MAFTEEQKAKLSDWITAKRISKLCPACGQETEWTMQDTFVALMDATIIGTELASSASTLPLAMLVCNNCSHVRLFAVRDAVSLM